MKRQLLTHWRWMVEAIMSMEKMVMKRELS